MKVKDLIEFLQRFDPEATVLLADYYYDCREGFSPTNEGTLSKLIVRAEDSLYYKHLAKENGSFVLIDTCSSI